MTRTYFLVESPGDGPTIEQWDALEEEGHATCHVFAHYGLGYDWGLRMEQGATTTDVKALLDRLGVDSSGGLIKEIPASTTNSWGGRVDEECHNVRPHRDC